MRSFCFYQRVVVVLTSNSLNDPDENRGSKESNEKAVNIKAVYTISADDTHNPTTQSSANDTDNDIEKDPLLPISVHYKRGDPTNQSTKNNPKNNVHNHNVHISIRIKCNEYFRDH